MGVTFSFREKGRGKNRADAMDRWWRGDIEEMDGRCEWSWLYFFDL